MRPRKITAVSEARWASVQPPLPLALPHPATMNTELRTAAISFDFVIKSGNQTLRKLHAISQREFHRISRELI